MDLFVWVASSNKANQAMERAASSVRKHLLTLDVNNQLFQRHHYKVFYFTSKVTKASKSAMTQEAKKPSPTRPTTSTNPRNTHLQTPPNTSKPPHHHLQTPQTSPQTLPPSVAVVPWVPVSVGRSPRSSWPKPPTSDAPR